MGQDRFQRQKGYDARREMLEATRLAARRLFCCRVCRRVSPQEDGIVIAFAGNVLLALHPECMTGPIYIERTDSTIKVEFTSGAQSNLMLLGDLVDSDVCIAKPEVQKVKL